MGSGRRANAGGGTAIGATMLYALRYRDVGGDGGAGLLLLLLLVLAFVRACVEYGQS